MECSFYLQRHIHLSVYLHNLSSIISLIICIPLICLFLFLVSFGEGALKYCSRCPKLLAEILHKREQMVLFSHPMGNGKHDGKLDSGMIWELYSARTQSALNMEVCYSVFELSPGSSVCFSYLPLFTFSLLEIRLCFLTCVHYLLKSLHTHSF